MAQNRSVFQDCFCYEICTFKTNATVHHLNNYFIYEKCLYIVIRTNFCIPLHGLLLMLWIKSEVNQLLQEVTIMYFIFFFKSRLSIHKSLKMYHYHPPSVCNFDQHLLEEK